MLLINKRDKIKWFQGITINDVFSVMGYNYPLITVFINDIFLSEDDYSTFEIPDEANVIIFHLAHGG